MTVKRTQEQWKHNASTGSYTLDLSKNTRLIRMGEDGRYMYKPEYWGDYSLRFPVHGGWHLTRPKAIAALRRLVRRSGRE